MISFRLRPSDRRTVYQNCDDCGVVYAFGFSLSIAPRRRQGCECASVTRNR
jgi:hypothetical protein